MTYSGKMSRGIVGLLLAFALVMSTVILGLGRVPFQGFAFVSYAYAAESNEDASFVYLGQSTVSLGEDQIILIGVGSEDARWDEAVLTLQTPSGSNQQVYAQEFIDNSALFTFAAQEAGVYRLLGVEASANSSSKHISFEESDYPCEFAVGATEAEVQALSLVEDVQTPEVAVYSVDEQGSLTVGTDLDEVADELSSPALFSARAAKASAADFVVGIDPGHGGYDGGAAAFGLKESDVTWGISNFCKEYLEANNIEVVMTREKDECPGLTERVERAVDAGADVFVSIHINSATSESAHGAEVWYPNNSSYKHELHEQGAKLSANILEKLVALGLTDRGIKVKNATGEYYYPDDSLQDYYTVIAESRLRGIVGIIVEHAFISNEAENAKLATPSFQQALGYADARGILETYGFKDAGMPSVGEDVKGAWQAVDGKWCYYDDEGRRVVGLQVVDQQRYFFNDEGFMLTGWISAKGVWYYGDTRGVLQTGWQTINKKRYYFNPENARMVTGVQAIGDETFVFDQSGACITGKGWVQTGGNWYYLLDGNMPALGWRSIGGAWYYLDPKSACMATGWTNVNGTWYYLLPSGVMCSPGWRVINGAWYYFEPSGAMATGWKSLNGSWYYLNPSGAMATGWANANGTWYYFLPSGVMCDPGWRVINGAWYYFEPSGAMATGWKSLNGSWYYLNPSGAMATGWANVSGTWYYFLPSGVMCDPGWRAINGAWYYFESSGAMATGWKTIGGSVYYLAPSDGHMFTGSATIDNHAYVFDASGVLVDDLGPVNNTGNEVDPEGPNGPETPVVTKTPIAGASQASASAMAAYYRSTGRSYPSYKYADKGAPTLEDFCRIVVEEANAEGIRAEAVFCQAMKETGWLQFGGTVDKDGKVQCNFAGIGAVTSTPGGATFADVREGLRAQVQHLKAYANTEPLNNACVDPRFTFVTRGIAPNLEDLNGRWAVPGDGYGETIASMINTLISFE